MTTKLDHPVAIAMWDFSWLERRWPGAGYEEPQRALDELVERGYDAVRIDAYPHLHEAGAEKEHTIVPCWNQQDWGSPAKNRVVLQPNLNKFIGYCRDRGVRVALSSWYQNDVNEQRLRIINPQVQARQWAGVLDDIAAAGLSDTILFVDLCNEWPVETWTPFFQPLQRGFVGAESLAWMTAAIAALRERHPSMRYCFSYTSDELPGAEGTACFEESFDLFEPHLWMAQANQREFRNRVGYHHEQFDDSGYRKMVDRAEVLYRADPAYWQGMLCNTIHKFADWSRRMKLPLVTTECWSVVDYKDWPLLDWEWVKELCALGTQTAAATGRWAGIATSNFCGPQFVGMWRDVAWHRRLTEIIHTSALPAEW